MTQRKLPSYVLGSFLAHGALGLALVLYARFRPPPPPEPTVSVTSEVDFIAPPPPPPVAEVTPPPPPPPTPVVPVPPTVDNTQHQATRVLANAPVENPNPAVEPGPVGGSLEPAPNRPVFNPPNTGGPSQPNARVLTAADLMGGGPPIGISDGIRAGIDLNQHGARPTRAIFGGIRGGGNPEEQARAAAMGPIEAALAENSHMNAAGTGANGRQVSRRAEEAFDPVTNVPNLTAAVMRAPLVTVTPPPRTVTPGELAAADGVDMHNGNQPLMVSIGRSPLPQASYHAVRVEVEVLQDQAGAVTASRVLSPSHVTGFDAEAQRAIREAIGMVRTPSSPNGRRTVWSIEVSNGAGLGDRILGGGNEGWRMLPEREGMQLRMRIRLTRAANLPVPGQPQGPVGNRPAG